MSWKLFLFNKNIDKIEPWFTNGLLISRKTKFKLSSIHSRNPTPENKQKFNSYRNLYNRLLRTAKNLILTWNLAKTLKTWKKPGNLYVKPWMQNKLIAVFLLSFQMVLNIQNLVTLPLNLMLFYQCTFENCSGDPCLKWSWN